MGQGHGWPATTEDTPVIYLIHFDRPYRHARHYLGFVRTEAELEGRIAKHRNGSGARLLAVVNAAGIAWDVVRTWADGDRSRERQIKDTRCVPDYCPVCRAARRGSRPTS